MTYDDIYGGNLSVNDFSLDTTWHNSKITCAKWAWYFHVILCYITFFAGIGAMLSRLHSRVKWTHVWFGRIYVIAMLWNTATSLLIHNTGLPVNTVILFGVIMLGIAIAWPIIMIHQNLMREKAVDAVQVRMKEGEEVSDLAVAINEEKGRIASRKTISQRMLSYKALHGIIMFVSWGCIAGRILASNQSGDFECYTHPVYKPVATSNANTKSYDTFNKTLKLVPIDDPFYDRLPWAGIGEVTWSAVLVIGYTIAAVVFGLVYAWRETVSASKSIDSKIPLATKTSSISSGSDIATDSVGGNEPHVNQIDA